MLSSDREVLNEQMIQAAAEGRLQAVAACVQAGADLHYINPLGYTVLAAALKHEQWEAAEQLLKQGFTPTRAVQRLNEVVPVGWSALSAAVFKERADWVQRLLALGLDPNAHDGKEETRDSLASPLLTAVRIGRTDLVELLMSAGAQASRASHLSNEVVMVAIDQKNLPLLQALLVHGADPNLAGRQLLSPLAFACRNSWTDGIGMLLRAGADPYAFSITSSRRGQTAFEAAATPVIRNFLQKTCVDVSVEQGTLDSATAGIVTSLYAKDPAGLARALQKTGTPHGALLGIYPLLPLAILLGDEPAAIALFKAGAEAQPHFQGGPYNPLIHAVDHNYLRLLAALLDGGLAPVLAPGAKGWSPLGLASSRGNIEAIELLVQHGAVINPDPRYPKSSPLILAASNGHLVAVQWFLAHGAFVDLVDNEGNTALLWGARSGSAEIVRALLTAGSKIDHRNKNGDSALALAALENKPVAVEALLQAGARDDFLYQTLREKNSSGPVLDLVAKFHGRAVAAPTATEFFSLPRTPADIRTFISRGGDIQYVGESTPLQIVIGRGEFQTAALLLGLGADPLALGKNEPRSPLLLAVHFAAISMDDQAALPVIKLLLEAGANANGDNPELKSPLHLAVSGLLLNTVNLLLTHGADPRTRNIEGANAFDVLFQLNLPLAAKMPIGRAMEAAAEKLPALPSQTPSVSKKTSF